MIEERYNKYAINKIEVNQSWFDVQQPDPHPYEQQVGKHLHLHSFLSKYWPSGHFNSLVQAHAHVG